MADGRSASFRNAVCIRLRTKIRVGAARRASPRKPPLTRRRLSYVSVRSFATAFEIGKPVRIST